MSATTTRDRLRECLTEVDFPAGKDELVAEAERKGDQATAKALRAIPPVAYADRSEVFASVRFDDDNHPG